MPKRTERLTIRLHPEEKNYIEETAKKSGINSSVFLRTLALIKEKLVILNESGSIAKAITKLQIDFATAIRKDMLAPSEKELFRNELNCLITLFNEVIDNTTAIDVDDEEDDEKEG